MLTGTDLRDARLRAGLTQTDLANLVGHTLRSVGNWERSDQVPRSAELKVRAILAGHLTQEEEPDALRSASDMELVAELTRRLAHTREEQGHAKSTAAISRAGGSPAPVTDALRAGDSRRAAVEAGHASERELDDDRRRHAGDLTSEEVAALAEFRRRRPRHPVNVPDFFAGHDDEATPPSRGDQSEATPETDHDADGQADVHVKRAAQTRGRTPREFEAPDEGA